MDIILFTILAVFAIASFIVGFFKRQFIVIIFSALAFIILGLFCMNGIQYVSSTTITTINSSVTTTANVYSNWNHYLGSSTNLSVNLVMAFMFMLFGLFLLYVGIFSSLDRKKSVDTSDDGD